MHLLKLSQDELEAIYSALCGIDMEYGFKVGKTETADIAGFVRTVDTGEELIERIRKMKEGFYAY